MRSPAAAVAWEFRQRHRWGLVAIVVYLIILAAIKLVILAHDFPIDFDSAETFAFVFVVPVSSYFTYFIAVFTFGLDGDLTARQSMYPSRMFTRPVSSAALAWWPMLFGAAASVILWTATRLLALWPSSIEVPVVWPGFLAVVLLAWAQALTWMPYGLPGVRVIAVIFWLTAIDTIVILAIHFRASEALMIAFLLPQIPLAYLVARYAVARARRGDVPDWSAAFTSFARIASASRPRKHFRSAARAQAWFEWRLSGKSLPVWVAIILPFQLLLFWVAGTSTVLVIELLLGVLFAPIIIATFAAATVSKPSVNVSDSYGLPPFMATRPLTNAQLIAAKLKTTLASTALAWLLIIVAVPIALEWSGEMPLVVERSRRFAQTVGTPRAVVFLLVVVAAFIASTWKQLVQTLYIGLTGRAWLIKGSIFATLTLLFFIGPIAEWIIETQQLGRLWSTLPLIFTLLVCVKMSAAVWIATRLFRNRLLSDRVLVGGAACWCVAVFALYGVLLWMLDTPHIPHYLLLLLAILAIPLARLSAAPLALAWNRNR
ncbi:MAG TPA: hypothetical protein VGJ62_03795 [Gemmatimonadaceae bacterium]